jgi:predicted house-cleaning noncanonical NTP pyrophosphatase (MazG superfamily)
MIKKYNKLVRDKIPEIITSKGESCVTEILDDKTYIEMLEKKLDEELAEYHKDKTVEELVDLIEVIYAIAATKGLSTYDLEMLRFSKRVERGGFDEKILLKETRDE